MAITWDDDYTAHNTCEAKGDWSGQGDFSDPKDNQSGSIPQMWREGTGCMESEIPSGKAGYWEDAININLTDKALTFWTWLSGPTEMGYIDYWSIRVEDGGDWVDYDFLPELIVLNVGGWFACRVWPTPSPEAHITNSGTPTPADIDTISLRSDNGSGNNIKVCGWDIIGSGNWMEAAADTVTLEDFVARDKVLDFGLMSQVGATAFQAAGQLRYGGTGTTTVNENNKSLSFKGANEDHITGLVFSSGGTTNITWTAMTFGWNFPQDAFIFTGTPNTFKITGCAFNGADAIPMPSDSANRWVRQSKFTGCGAGTASDGEFTDNILDTCLAMTISGDADFTGTQVLTPAVAADTSGLVWNGNLDPDGNLDGMTFSKGANAHHAIEFGTATPTEMTLRDIDFSGFHADNGENDSTLHVKRLSGTVTINLSNVTGNVSYKSAGATVVIQNSVDVNVVVTDEEGDPVETAQVAVYEVSDDSEVMNQDTDPHGEASTSLNYTADTDIYIRVRKSSTGATKYFPFNGTGTITASGFTLNVRLIENTLADAF
ncbi:MAG: hypothetical protein GY769_07730 [bacterium]|nr:hypothetical protein [bacterium]